MNRSDFQRLVRIRLREARLLLSHGCYEGAFYLGGYAVECALKACIAKKTRRYDFPDHDTKNKYYIHNLVRLASAVGPELLSDLTGTVGATANWAIVTQWTEESRYYSIRTKEDVENLIGAISDRHEGILRCIRRHW